MRIYIKQIITIFGLSLINSAVFAATPSLISANHQLLKVTNLETKKPLNTDLEKFSYTLGVQLGKNLKRQGVNINPDLLAEGIRDVNENNRIRMTSDEMKQVVATFQKQLLAKRTSENKTQAETNAKIGEEFLTKNAQNAGVHTLANGLQYKIITKGKGPNPNLNDVVTVNYTGRFIDGKVFDSSEQHGQPATFSVSEVIPGWREALKMMQPGATWEIFVPAKLGYGEEGVDNIIGPNQTLIFRVQLLAIKRK